MQEELISGALEARLRVGTTTDLWVTRFWLPEPSRSTARLCFRVVRSDGQPVSCGYQGLVLVHKDTQDLLPAPPMLAQYLDPSNPYSLIEKLVDPSFERRVHGGSSGVKQVMSPEICELGAKVANADLSHGHPRIIDGDGREYAI